MSQALIADDSVPVCPVAPGEIIDGKYRIERPIAFGGMGVVCAATHVGLGTPVAIKLVRNELARNPDATVRFLNEARAAAALKGEHVARVIDCGTLPTSAPYMVMEYLQGADLWSVVANRGPLPVTTAVDYVLQACEALAEAHAAQIIHRDVKPENLFLTERPDGTSTIKVLDFGISKQLQASERGLTNPNNGLGSPYYMSPEQMCSPSDVDARSDIWSIGCVMYVLLSGQLPFYSESVASVCAKVLSEEPTPIRQLCASVPEELEAVIARCLRKERQERFLDVAELVSALSPFGSEETEQSITRVRRILARSSDPPGGGALAQRAPHFPLPPALPLVESTTMPRLVGVLQTPIAVVPLVRRRPPVRRNARARAKSRKARPSSYRSLVVIAVALLASGGALLGARALGYELPPLLSEWLPNLTIGEPGAQAPSITVPAEPALKEDANRPVEPAAPATPLAMATPRQSGDDPFPTGPVPVSRPAGHAHTSALGAVR